MLGNIASIFTQVYIAKVTSIFIFFPHLLYTVPFTSLSLFEPMWTFSWLFSFATVTGSMYSRAFAFSRWRYSSQSHCKLKLIVKRSILLFGLSCWSPAVQNVGIHYAGVHKIPEDVPPCFDWEVANIIFHAHLIMTIYTIPVSIIQLNVSWLIYLDHIMT